jgi:hypothetical protein
MAVEEHDDLAGASPDWPDDAFFFWRTLEGRMTYGAARACERLRWIMESSGQDAWLKAVPLDVLITYPPVDEYRRLSEAWRDRLGSKGPLTSDRAAAEYLDAYVDFVDLSNGFAGTFALGPQLLAPIAPRCWELYGRLLILGWVFCAEMFGRESDEWQKLRAEVLARQDSKLSDDREKRRAKDQAQRGGAARAAQAGIWHEPALAAAIEIRAAYPSESDEKLAGRVIDACAGKGVKMPDLNTVRRQIGRWVKDKDTALPPSTRKPSKTGRG